MKSKLLSGAALIAVAAPFALTAAPALAQDTQLQEVVVTARKRQESILNVPVVTTALPAEQLDRLQTNDLRAIATLVPGLALGGSVLSIGTQVSLRGVGTTAYDPGIDQSVSLNIDGLQLSQGLAYSSGMFDAGQVEVLKGPQALFYGKSSPGGVIAVRTADPTNDFEVLVRGGYEFEAREKRGELVVSGPITDTLRGRLAGYYAHQDGFYKNTERGPLPPLGGRVASDRISESENWMVRGTLLWNPTDQFNARLKINHVKDLTYNPSVLNLVRCPEGLAGPFGLQLVSPTENCQKDRNLTTIDMDPAAYGGWLPRGGRDHVESTQTYGTLELNYELMPNLTLTSQTGYYLLSSKSLFNAVQSSFFGVPLAVTNGFRRRQLTQELRLNSDFTSQLNFTAGAFVERGKFTDLVTYRGNTTLGLGLTPVLQAGIQTIEIETNSVFGQLRYQVLPQLEVAFGARYTDETRTNDPVDLTTGVPIRVSKPTTKLTASNTSPELTLTYRPTDWATIFGALKRGYKSGSFNVATPPVPGADNSFGDEMVEGGEIGLKTRLLDRTLAFNIAAYWYDYTGLQVGSIQPIENNLPVTTTINAGSARVRGIEADMSYRPPQVQGLSLIASVNYNHAYFNSLRNVPCYGGQTAAEGCVVGANGLPLQDLSGLPLVRSAKWQANFGFNYERSIGRDMTLAVTNSNQLSSKYLVNIGYPWYQDGFIKSDLSLAVRGPENRWEVALIGRNLTNRLTSGNCTNANVQGGLIPAGVDEIGCWMDRGREVWVRVSYRPFN